MLNQIPFSFIGCVPLSVLFFHLSFVSLSPLLAVAILLGSLLFGKYLWVLSEVLTMLAAPTDLASRVQTTLARFVLMVL